MPCSSDANRRPAPSPTPSSHGFLLVLHIGTRQRGRLEVVEGKHAPLLFLPRVINLDQGEVRIKNRRRRLEELMKGQALSTSVYCCKESI